MQNEQITVIEEKVAHQDHAVQQMSDTVVAQQRQIDLLLKRVETLERQLRLLAHSVGIEIAAQEKPPHY